MISRPFKCVTYLRTSVVYSIKAAVFINLLVYLNCISQAGNVLMRSKYYINVRFVSPMVAAAQVSYVTIV